MIAIPKLEPMPLTEPIVTASSGGEEGRWEDGCIIPENFEETDDISCAGCHPCELFCRGL